MPAPSPLPAGRALLLAVTLCVAAGCAGPADVDDRVAGPEAGGVPALPAGIEPRVRELLDELTASRSTRTKQRFQVVETRDVRDPHGRRIQYHHRFAGSRVLPDRLALEMRGDLHHTRLWQNPDQLVVLDQTTATYRELPLDSTPAEIMAAFGGGERPSPLRHFLHPDPVVSFLDGVVSAQYLGLRDEYDQPHHHLLLSTETVDRQLWIETGRETRITKFVEAYRTDPGLPRYTLTLEIATEVDLIPESLFEFEPPEGARPAEDEPPAGDAAAGEDTPGDDTAPGDGADA